MKVSRPGLGQKRAGQTVVGEVWDGEGEAAGTGELGAEAPPALMHTQV